MTSSVRALSLLFERVVDEPGTAAQAWQTVLEAPFGSFEFSARHAAAMSLLNDIDNVLATMSEETARRYRGYHDRWWSALVLPDDAWSSGGTLPARATVGRASFDQLASLADLVDAKLAGTSFSPLGSLDPLESAAIALLEAARSADGLNDGARLELVGLTKRVIWLSEREHLFGTSQPVVAAATAAVVGNAAAPPKQISPLRRAAAGLAASVTIATGGLTVTAAALQESQVVVEQLGGLIHEVRELPHSFNHDS